MTRQFNNYDVAKSVAFLFMVIDHIGYYFFPQCLFLRALGRASAIIFALLFGITKHKKNEKILYYAFATALILYYFEGNTLPLNILFNFYLSYFLLEPVEHMYDNHKYLFNFILILLIPLSFMTNIIIEYGVFFTFLVFCGKLLAKENKTKRDRNTAIALFILYFVYQIINFAFRWYNCLIVAVLFILIFKNMYNFKLKDLPENRLLKFISRYSLQLYTLHLLLFSIIYRCLL